MSLPENKTRHAQIFIVPRAMHLLFAFVPYRHRRHFKHVVCRSNAFATYKQIKKVLGFDSKQNMIVLLCVSY